MLEIYIQIHRVLIHRWKWIEMPLFFSHKFHSIEILAQIIEKLKKKIINETRLINVQFLYVNI